MKYTHKEYSFRKDGIYFYCCRTYCNGKLDNCSIDVNIEWGEIPGNVMVASWNWSIHAVAATTSDAFISIRKQIEFAKEFFRKADRAAIQNRKNQQSESLIRKEGKDAFCSNDDNPRCPYARGTQEFEWWTDWNEIAFDC